MTDPRNYISRLAVSIETQILGAKKRLVTLEALKIADREGILPDERQSGLTRVPAVVIRYNNRGEWRRVDFADVELIDIEGVTANYINAYSPNTGVIRGYRDAPQIVLVTEASYRNFQAWKERLREL